MAETYAGRLDPGAGVYLDHIREGAARMESLLADMVDYWAIAGGDRRASRTDMEAVLSQALLYTDKQILEQGAIVTHDAMPAVMGNFDVLAKVLRHLIRNAIGYCETPPASVHVSCKREDADWVFSVRDNGAGIAPAFHGRVFGVFRRLHGREHPGNGLGLAFCKKAVEWHGGRMWVESAPGAGSTFFFTLPPVE
jgi:light-regulated signal transduction histidine kinase (bacteriophytochrome)